MTERLDYRASCRKLYELGWPDFEPAPAIPARMPRYDDEEPLGVQFFRTVVEGDLSHLTLPRTYFCRSEIREASFRDTDLRESSLCWSDFVDVDFGSAVLSSSDLRASLFERVSFIGADLRSTDLRHSTFVNCAFDNAAMKGTIFTRSQGQELPLSDSQRREVDWRDDAGPEPDGG